MEKSQINKKSLEELKVAIVHDFLDTYGGAEQVLEVICEIFPQAPIYTLLYDRDKMRGKFKNKEIHTSFLQNFPEFLKKKKKYLLPFMPTAPETFDLRDFDLVISSSGAWSKGIITRLNTIHISYLHSPMRFVWDYNGRYLKDLKKKLGIFQKMFLTYLRVWDFEAAQRPDALLVNSNFTKKRVSKYYRRDSQIIYPPLRDYADVNVDKDNELKDKNYFLIVSRLSAYKKVDLAVEAFNKMGLPLVVIGEGEEEGRLRKIAKENIKILGWQKDEVLKKYYQNARAFIFPAIDDFGLTMIEAMNFGVPVVAINKGGAKEIVREGITGEFFAAQTVEVLADGVRRFLEKEKSYDKAVIKNEAQKFSKQVFKDKFSDLIKKELEKK